MAQEPPKEGFSLFKKVKSFLEPQAGSPDAVPAPPAPAPAQPPVAGARPAATPLAPGRTPSGRLQSDVFRANASQLRATAPPAPIARETGELAAAANASTLPLAQPPVEQTDEERAVESEKRLAFVMAYLKDPAAFPQFKDPRFVYKLVSDERSYQAEVCRKLEVELKAFLGKADPYFLTEEYDEIPAMPPGPDGGPHPDILPALERNAAKRAFQADRDRRQEEIQKSRNVQTQLFLVLKRVTGIKGKTGGTGFLPQDDRL